jgi:hypothetical protein
VQDFELVGPGGIRAEDRGDRDDGQAQFLGHAFVSVDYS